MQRGRPVGVAGLIIFLSCLMVTAALAQEKNVYINRTVYTSGGEFIRVSAEFSRPSFSLFSKHSNKFSRPSANFAKPFMGINKGISLHKGEFSRHSFYIRPNKKEFSSPAFYISGNREDFSQLSFVIAPEEEEFSKPSFDIVYQSKEYRK
ncbi:MAG: hypothetical protein ISS89_04535 [Candidatus Omnitrophica bacterium]|nr:hypothetical protein [Candidatus Omnitrophota bacterium]